MMDDHEANVHALVLTSSLELSCSISCFLPDGSPLTMPVAGSYDNGYIVSICTFTIYESWESVQLGFTQVNPRNTDHRAVSFSQGLVLPASLQTLGTGRVHSKSQGPSFLSHGSCSRHLLALGSHRRQKQPGQSC